jgi:hypothetical protein
MNYDIIGDIHGHDGALVALLNKLGYRQQGGAWHKAGHQVIFVGDFIDRGPGQMETVNLVRSMVDIGSALAVMGNHEFNALAWHTPEIHSPDQYLRPHSDKNYHQHKAFLSATNDYPTWRQEALDWFMTLPLWLDLPELRAVHACWHPEAMTQLLPELQPGNRLDLPLLHAACQRGSAAYAAVEVILKGPEVILPDGMRFEQGDTMRSEARTRWWDAAAITFKASAIVDGTTRQHLPEVPIPNDVRFGYADDRPVFIGHYWMQGVPQILAPQVACVDYSAGRGEPLVAYRWQGESELLQEHFVSAVG